MIPKKSHTKRQRSKFEEDCYDASSLEEDYDNLKEEAEEIEDAKELEDAREEEEALIRAKSSNVSTQEVLLNADKPKKRGPKPTRVQYYVDPKEFDDCIISYYNSGIISDLLATMISKIAHKLSYAPNFINYTYRDEMVGDAVVRMMKALIAKKYTHNKGSNPFSYFTKIAFNAFRNRIKREKHTHETLQKYQEEIIMNSEYINFIKNRRSMTESEDSLFVEEC